MVLKTENVIKRNGSTESFNPEKIHRVLYWACNDINGVSISEIEMKANVQLYDEINTDDIHELLIKSTADLITEDSPNYQYVAARLINYKLRKNVYGHYDRWSLKDIIDHNIKEKVYDDDIVNKYNYDEINVLDSFIKDDRDNDFTYAAMEQWREKYLVQQRGKGVYYETPQIAYMMVAATLFSNYPKDTRLSYVKKYYDAISQFYISLPTPIMAGLRTPTRQFSSCVLIESGDSLDSINATASAVVNYISRKAGIGLGVGSIRAEGSKIRNGDVVHTGIIPFLKYFQAAVKSCSQGGVRGGAATAHFPMWHREFENLLVLKNNKGTEETRVRQLDYSVQINKLMYERLISGGNITFFSPSDVPGLYDTFFSDQDKFKELYEKYERSKSIEKITRPAIDVFSDLLQERKETGRIYVQHIDHVNSHGSFVPELAPIRMSNLCQEIALPTVPMDNVVENGEIALCTLSALNWGLFKKPEDMEPYCDLAVRGLDELLSYQDYPVKAAETSTVKYRPLGIGIINLAFFLAKRGLTYSDPDALKVIDEYAEAWSYYLIKSSVAISKEFGSCDLDAVRYNKGIFPIDTYKKEVDELTLPTMKMDWEWLREEAKIHGVRNATLMALMPAETSAQISNSTNGIEPVRSLVSYKQSKNGVLAQVVPEIHRLKNKYDLLWDQKSPEGYIKIAAVLQRYIDQSISVNTSYNPAHYEDNELPFSELLRDLISTYRYGLKNLYYFNTNDGATDEMKEYEKPLPDLAEEDDCDSCKI